MLSIANRQSEDISRRQPRLQGKLGPFIASLVFKVHLFSVVIPSFNREETIADTLDSIDRQTFRDFEVIVVDDGSTDGTVAIVETYSFVRLIRQENAGPGAARNRGAQAAAGAYIAFLDSDDVWFPWTLLNYARMIHLYDQPAFLTGRPKQFYRSEDLLGHTEAPVQVEWFSDYLSSSDRWRWFGVSSFVIRRDAFLEIGGFADGRINGEDADLAIRLGISPTFIHLNEPAQFGYRVHDGNITNDTSKSIAGLKWLLHCEKYGRYPGGPARAKERARIISRHVRPFAIALANKGELRLALFMYCAILRAALRERRVKFILGFPLLLAAGLAKVLLLRK